MGDGENFERLKGETLDLLVSSGGCWMGFDEISCVREDCDGEVDELALRGVLVDLVAEGAVERNDDDEYRRTPPQEGENLVEKLKLLEAENERLRADMAAVELAKEKVDALADAAAKVVRLEAENERLMARDADLLAALRLCAHADATGNPHLPLPEETAGRIYRLGVEPDALDRDGSRHVAEVLLTVLEESHARTKEAERERNAARAEQAADRAAVRSLVEKLPRCEALEGCGATATGGVWDGLHADSDGYLCDAHLVDEFEEAPYAGPLRALQARMAMWESMSPGDAAPSQAEVRAEDTEEPLCAGPCCGGYGYEEDA